MLECMWPSVFVRVRLCICPPLSDHDPNLKFHFLGPFLALEQRAKKLLYIKHLGNVQFD